MSSGFSFVLIAVAALLDISANLLLEKSEGFRHKKYGIPALIFVCLAFTLLTEITKTVELTIAYITWGAMAILGTAIMAGILFQQKLNWKGWTGIAAILASIILLNMG